MGAQWVLLQGAAWASMALREEAVDLKKPCSMCLTAREGAASQQERQQASAPELRLDLAFTRAPALEHRLAAVDLAPFVSAHAVAVVFLLDPPPPQRLPVA